MKAIGCFKIRIDYGYRLSSQCFGNPPRHRCHNTDLLFQRNQAATTTYWIPVLSPHILLVRQRHLQVPLYKNPFLRLASNYLPNLPIEKMRVLQCQTPRFNTQVTLTSSCCQLGKNIKPSSITVVFPFKVTSEVVEREGNKKETST